MDFVLVHANVAKLKFPFESKQMEGFTSQIESINQIGFSSSGFVSEPEIKDKGVVFDDSYLVNITIWESVEDLKAFTYSGKHLEALKNRSDWFVEHDLPKYVLFWTRPDQEITEKLVKDKLIALKQKGPSPKAFTFNDIYPR